MGTGVTFISYQFNIRKIETLIWQSKHAYTLLNLAPIPGKEWGDISARVCTICLSWEACSSTVTKLYTSMIWNEEKKERKELSKLVLFWTYSGADSDIFEEEKGQTLIVGHSTFHCFGKVLPKHVPVESTCVFLHIIIHLLLAFSEDYFNILAQTWVYLTHENTWAWVHRGGVVTWFYHLVRKNSFGVNEIFKKGKSFRNFELKAAR